jgi:hypothetical protein
MISAAVLYARGIVPLSAIHAALELPYHIGFPLAPSVGLVLVNSGFSRNVNSQVLSTLHNVFICSYDGEILVIKLIMLGLLFNKIHSTTFRYNVYDGTRRKRM